MPPRRDSPCLVCGKPTRCVVRQPDPGRGDRAIPLCAECISLWQSQPAGRPLMLAASRCWGAGAIRFLCREEALEDRQASSE